MTTLKNYFDYSQLAMAAYGDLDPSFNGEDAYTDALIDNTVRMSLSQAEQFADTYTILDQLPDDPQSGFSATVFRRGAGADEEYTL